MFPRIEAHVQAASGQARSPRARARDPRPLGARADVRAAAASRTAAGPRFSFVDGPVTANRMMLGVHTAWGRTLKDVFQRYKALRGFEQRYQNGFDCQGLWIEVGVERELGLNSKREIEEFGLAEFARRCREVVVRSSRGADRAARSGSASGWTGARTTSPSATRTSSTSGGSCGSCTSAAGSTSATARPSGARAAARRSPRTSCVGSYVDRADPSLFVRFPLLDQPRRVARDLDDDAVDAARERRGRGQARRRVRPARERRLGRGRALSGRDVRRAAHRRRARRLALRGALRHARARRGRRASRDPVGRRHPRGRHRHRPHRARAAAPRTSSSRASTTCPC